jgi:ABC-type siderophore export system fused ATPase/permease subunit
VLDEWAADQDPMFRKFFYETILTDLRKQGKTIIAATHDDKYFGIADRILKMEYGELVDYKGV